MKSAREIEGWLLEQLRARLGQGAEPIDAHLPFSYYGLDSIDAVELAAELEQWLGSPVEASLTFDYPTASAVAAYLAGSVLSEEAEAPADLDALLAELDLSAHSPSSSASGPTVK